jgi:ribosome-binding protein aMBF1 (putative translation factor)
VLLRVIATDIDEVRKVVKKKPRKKRRADEELATIAQVIQTKRDQLGFTQEALAEKLNISPMTLQFIEQGRRFPSFPMLVLLCDSLGLKLKIE